jgi:hypothetical protein
MPTYTFELRDGSRPIEGGDAIILPDRDHARAYGRNVVVELMSYRELQTRSWRLDAYENNSECETNIEWIFEIPFASVDHSLNHLKPELRKMIEKISDRQLALKEAVYAAGITIRESRALLARSRGRPYLVSCVGENTIRRSNLHDSRIPEHQ